MGADFSGYATKANLKCSDGRTIMADAFKHQDQTKVPLVWQHTYKEPGNVLGHAILEWREDGVYAHGYFNDSDAGKNAKTLVQHGDINALSIYANKLVEKSKQVLHGTIREVSLVLAGANPGAFIDFVNIAHSDGEIEQLEDEAVIYTGLALEHADQAQDTNTTSTKETDVAEKTVQDIFDSMTEEQKNVVYFMIGQALKGEQGKVAHSAETAQTVSEVFDTFDDSQKEVVYFMIGQALEEADATHSDDDTQEGNSMKHNVFEADSTPSSPALSHSDAASIFDGAKRLGSMKEAVEDYALKHGIENIDILFPDARAITNTPDFEKRRTEWVAEVMNTTRHTPFSRIKSMTANLTLPEARAKGYVKGNLKKEEFFRVAKRTTTPQTIYKKQKLDRDDVLDITDFDVVVWLKGEMRLMLEEEIARAVLIGDGRSAGDDDKIQEDHIRPIATDDDLYVTYLNINLGDAESTAEEIIDSLTLQRRHYRGSGNPTFYTSETVLAQLLLIKDKMGRRIYPTVNDLAAALRVSKVVTVEVMDEPSVNIIGIVVNLADYTIGADRGGDVALFDDFDIDYNQYKYLIETRMSGALVKAKSALVLRKTASTDKLVTPVKPSYDKTKHQLTVATTAGITYKNKDTNTTLTTASPVTLAEGDEITVIAIPDEGYYLASSTEDEFLVDYAEGVIAVS